MNKILGYSMAALVTSTPKYYTDLNKLWDEVKPRQLKRYEGNTDLVLTDTYDIALPVVDLDPKSHDAMVSAYSFYIIPAFEIAKRKFEYKKIQIMMSWKMTELRDGPEPTLVYTNKKVELTNEQEIRDFISDQEPQEIREQLRLELFELEDEIDILNSSLETYDAIIYLDLHGLLIQEEPVDDRPTIDFGFKMSKSGNCIPGLYPVCSIPESDAEITFITATKPGVNNIDELSVFFRNVEALVNRQLEDTHSIDILKLQKDIRQLKKQYIQRVNIQYQYTPEEKLKIFQGFWDNFEKDKGWGITKNKWLNKKLVPDLKFGIPVRVLYDEPSIHGPLDKDNLIDRILEANGRNTHALRSDKERSITTNELVQYLIDAGRKNVLIIDTSCFEQRLYDDLRTERRLVREAVKEGVASVEGGTRKKKRKNRKTRRR
jgi:hypothetical protein